MSETQVSEGSVIQDLNYPFKRIIEMTEYRGIRDHANFSLLSKVLKSPAHAFEELQNPSEPTPAMIAGSNIHLLINEYEKFLLQFVTSPNLDRRTTAYKEFAAQHPGKTLIDEKTWTEYMRLRASVLAHPWGAKALEAGEAEASYFFKDVGTGFPCKIRPDRVIGRTLIDFKTTEDASLDAFQRSVFNYKYHMQAAFYLDGMSAATGERFNDFLIVAIEKKAPYAVAVYRVDEGALDKGRELYRKALNLWAQCVKINEYPAYSHELQAISLPHWGFSE